MPMDETIRAANPSDQADITTWLRGILTPAGSDTDVVSGLAGGIQGLANPELADRQKYLALLAARAAAEGGGLPPSPDTSTPPPTGEDHITPPGAGVPTLQDVAGRGITGPSSSGPILQGRATPPVVGQEQALPPELSHEMQPRPTPDMVHADPNREMGAPIQGKHHLLSSILKGMGLAAGAVALGKFGGPGALEGGLGGLASGWAHTKKQLMDEERKMQNESLQRQLDDAHSVVSGLMNHQIDLTKIPELNDAYQKYVTGYHKGKLDLKGAQGLNLAYAQHAHEVAQQVIAREGQLTKQQALQKGLGQNEADLAGRTVQPGQSAPLTPQEAAHERMETLRQMGMFRQQQALQAGGFAHAERMQSEGFDKAGAAQFNAQLQETAKNRGHYVLSMRNNFSQNIMGKTGQAPPPELEQKWQQDAEQLFPEPTPSAALTSGRAASRVMQPPPSGPKPTVAPDELRTTPDGKKWKRVPNGWQQIQ